MIRGKMPETYRYYTRDIVPQRFADLTCPLGFKPPPTVTFWDPSKQAYIEFYNAKAFNLTRVEAPKKATRMKRKR